MTSTRDSQSDDQKPDNPLIAPVSLISILRQIEDGSLTPEQSIQASLERISAHDPAIKAFECVSQNALDEAKSRKGPLAGIGLAIKDVFDTQDLKTECNSPIYHGCTPNADASLVAMSRAAGCSVLGKTVTTEFAFFQPGATCNPHNLDHTPGGSSSGSAAAVAAGMAPLALGTQTGGSVIRPASFCGVAGFKPSAGLLPTVGMKTFSWSLDTAGLFAKGVEDVAYAASVLTGRHMRVDDGQISNPTLGIARTHSWNEANPAYREQFESLVSSLSTFGINLIDIPITDEFIAAFHAHQVIQDYEAKQALCWEYENHPDKLSPLLRETLDFAQTIKPSDYDEARMLADYASQQLDEVFEDVDAIISLSAPGPALKSLASTGSSIFNRTWTLFGLPCINVPGLMSEDCLPLGIQIIGPYMHDHDALLIADMVEKAIQRHLSR
ncbi:MAG: amidase [Cohaesibacter sp.]|nr:amidase [Cohaesibacter sp.]